MYILLMCKDVNNFSLRLKNKVGMPREYGKGQLTPKGNTQGAEVKLCIGLCFSMGQTWLYTFFNMPKFEFSF